MLNIIQKPTPNFAVGRGKYKPEMIVLHISTASAESCISWFANPTSQVSSNYLIGIKRDIYQFVKDEDKAQAQGIVDIPTSKIVSSRPGINPNYYCLSIEHAGIDLSKAPIEQLEDSAALVRSLCDKWGIPLDRDYIIGHYEIRNSKPNCPATDKSVIDKIIQMAKALGANEPTTAIQVPNSKVDRVLAFIKTI